MPLLIIFLILFTHLKLQSLRIEGMIGPIWDSCPEEGRHLKLQFQGGSQTHGEWFPQRKLTLLSKSLEWMLEARRQRLSTLISKDTLWLVLTHYTNLIQSFHWVLSLSFFTLLWPSLFWRHQLQILEPVLLRNLLETQLLVGWLVFMWCILYTKQFTYLSTRNMNSV